MIRRAPVPLLLLLAYAIAFAAAALGVSLVAFDDHPGQVYRVWHVVTQGVAPWRWNEGWWAGYPELQFYPPGFAYAAALLHRGSVRLVTVEASYQTVLWLAYVAPGVTTWALLARLGAGGWGALPGAFIALTLSAGVTSGVEGGVRTGMLAARLGWALLPVLGVLLVRWGAGGHPPVVAPALLTAALVLTHPAHVPAAIALVLLVALAVPPRWARLGHAAGMLALAALLTAFWTIPLLARLRETRALAWGRLSLADLVGLLRDHPLLAVLLALALCGVAFAQAPVARAFMRWPWVVGVVVALDAAVLERLGLRWLPADRLADAAWLSVVVAGGLTLARMLALAARRWTVPEPALALAAVAVAVVLALPTSTLTLWPRTADWPTMAATTRGLRLAEFWTALRDTPPGRVLFVRSGVPLVYGAEWWRPHTHVTALTPLQSGRAIVNGTFTHPSPVAALVYRGAGDGGPIRELVERLDGHSLFGTPLARLDAETFNRYADRLGVSVVVALDDDSPHLPALDLNAEFAPARASPPFVLWTRSAPVALPKRVAPDRWRVRLESNGEGWAPARLTYYPLWRAVDAGVELRTRRGAFGDLEVELSQPVAVVDLMYTAGTPEVAGAIVSACAAVLIAGVAVEHRRRRRTVSA